MKNKGFTLIELLAAIVLLAILTLITVTTASSQYKKEKSKLSLKQQKMIKLSAEMYVTDNKEAIKKQELNCFSLPVKFLIDEGYLDEDIKDVNTKELLKDSKLYVNVTQDLKKFSYDVKSDENDKCNTLSLTEEGEE